MRYAIENKKGEIVDWAVTAEEAEAIANKGRARGWVRKVVKVETDTTEPAEWELAGFKQDPIKVRYESLAEHFGG